MKLLITTGGRPDEHSIQLAKKTAEYLNVTYIDRKKRSISRLHNEYSMDVLVAGKGRFDLYRVGMEKPFFFHPNTAAFRLKRLLNGERDPLVEACNLIQGDSFIDCTLGLAGDSIIASHTVGTEGNVIGIEADPVVSFIVKNGLVSFSTEDQTLKEAMARIEVVQAEAISFLRTLPANSASVVFLDPMFEERIEESDNFKPLRHVGKHGDVTYEWMQEAIRVASKRVVLKAHYRSRMFEEFGMTRIVRPNTKFHFGYLEI